MRSELFAAPHFDGGLFDTPVSATPKILQPLAHPDTYFWDDPVIPMRKAHHAGARAQAAITTLSR